MEYDVPADTRIDDDWFDARKSEYAVFFPNPQLDEGQPNPEREVSDESPPEARTDARVDREKLKKWIGALASRPSKKVVVGNILVSLGIDTEHQKNQIFPVEVPCFLLQRQTAWIATAIDYDRMKREVTLRGDDIFELKKRMTNLESRFVQLDSHVRRLDKVSQSEDLLVVFDYQNFNTTCKKNGVFIHPSQIVDNAAKFFTVVPRNIVQAIVVDFDGARHVIWKKHKNFEFYKVPEICPGFPNPTDQCVYKATLEAIEKHQLRRGSVIAIVSGDHHFIPLLHDLKARGFQTMVIAYYPEHIAENMIGKPDYYINLVSPSALPSVTE